jgi:hypothetical protein
MTNHRGFSNAMSGMRHGSMSSESSAASSTYSQRTLPSRSLSSDTSRSGSIATAGLNLAKYYQTENVMNGTQALWSPTTFTWPNYLTIASASITFVSASVVLLAYCWGRDVAERFDNRRAWIAKLLIVVQIVSAATAAIVMYKTGNSSNSLTGQTCGAPPAKAPQFPQLNFDTYCLRQVCHALIIFFPTLRILFSFAALPSP